MNHDASSLPGAGFIGSEFARLLVELGYDQVVVYDKLTYAGNPANIDVFVGIRGIASSTATSAMLGG
jgi:dTDP-D-glucose 4,6-dehydratase